MAENLKKVVCLYRVSTKKQVDEDDIPMQKQACRAFIKTHSNWVLTKEYFEKGVSGFKKYAAQRDVLQQVRNDAIQNKFNILLVFMFDRLGRKEDETPFIVEWFVKQGVEIWSVKEGEQKFEHHVDKLMNYIRFWQASGESEKTSIRVDTKLRQMAHEGIFHGGTAPYGYKLVPSGVLNKKKKELLKMEIDEEQAKVVKMIFDYVYQKGYGRARIAQELNKQNIKTLSNRYWNACTIGTMLKNPVYKGYPAYGKRSSKTGTSLTQSKNNWVLPECQIKELVIVDSDIWSEVQNIITNNRNLLSSNAANKITKSPCLFIGIIYCGYCGYPLTTTYSYGWNKYKTKRYKYAKYRCSGKASKCVKCQGQTLYSAKNIEQDVLQQTKIYLTQIYNEQYDNSKSQSQNNFKEIQKISNSIEKKISKTQNEHDVLLQEISKSLMGESAFKPETLSNLIEQKEDNIKNLKKEKENIDKELNDEKIINNYNETFKDVVKDWNNFLKKLNFDKKKMYLRQIINKITVYKDKIDITFNSNFLQFVKIIEQETK